MKTILRLEELNSCGMWSCYCPKDVAGIGNRWYTPARALGMELTDYIEMVVNKFHPDEVFYSDYPPHLLVLFRWKKQADMRVFKNWINKQLREKQFYIDIA